MRQIALLQRGVDQRAPAVVRLDEKLLVVVIVGGAQGRIEQVRADLELLDERRFAGGAVYLRYKLLG